MRVALFKSVNVVAASFFLLAATCSLNCLAAPADIAGAAQQPAEHKGCSDSPAAPGEPSSHECSHHEGSDFVLKSKNTLWSADMAPVMLAALPVTPAIVFLTEPVAVTSSLVTLVLPPKLNLPLRI